MMFKKNIVYVKKKYLYILFILFLLLDINFIEKIYILKKEKNNKFGKKCYLSFENKKLKIVHIIITRFLLNYSNDSTKEYILNGIRVMKKYLLPSLENQSCKDFFWVLMTGSKINTTFLKSLLNFNNSFQWYIIYAKDIRIFLRNITKGSDILITTRIDYDDRIYYDAVNDVRKEINLQRPIFIYGYNKGLYYFELDNKYYDFEFKSKYGAFSIFESLIIVLNKVNDTYNIYDFGYHNTAKRYLLINYKSLGIKKLKYDPAIFDNGAPKFVWVRQKYSWSYNISKLSKIKKILKVNNNFNLNKFYGK